MEDHLVMARRVFDIEIHALQNGRENLNSKFSEAVELIRMASVEGRTVVMGVGKSGHIGKKVSSTLSSTGTPSVFVHPAEAAHGDLGMITKKDIVIAISHSGRSEELLRLVPYFKRNHISIISFTGDDSSPLARLSDIVISTAVEKEACLLGLAPTASTTLTLALGDALAICLSSALKFSREDFAATHPEGALGRKLLLGVVDVMVELRLAPIVSDCINIKDALVAMSRGGMGFLVIIDDDRKPVGVYTDGDLRRTLDLDVDIKQTPIKEVMTKSFISISNNQLAVVAVALMDKHKVSALPVLDDMGLVVGAINMRQLLQAGVV